MTIEQRQKLLEFVAYPEDREQPHIYGHIVVQLSELVPQVTGTISVNNVLDDGVAISSSYFVQLDTENKQLLLCNYPYKQIKSVFLIKKWPNQSNHTELEIK